MTSKKQVNAYWYKGLVPNFGDEITPFLIEKLFLHEAIHKIGRIPYFDQTIYGAGSIISHARIPFTAIIWGSGIISNVDRVVRPYSVRAVRGPRSRLHLISKGISCPESYGDPALLLPMIIPPKISRSGISVIPHYVDYSFAKKIIGENKEYKLIDVREGVDSVVNKIIGSECVISSSLHGLIVASAYNIPCCWVKFSNKLYGDDVKFYDFFESCETNATPSFISNDIDLSEVFKRGRFLMPNVAFCQKNLINVAPFKGG